MQHRRVANRPVNAAVIAALMVLFAAGIFGSPAPAHADADDFTVTSFHADYVLGRDAEGRSTLHTTEEIEVLFPDFDQNRGIIRDLPRVYDDHPTDLEVISVTDQTGAPREFSTDKYGDFLSVTMAVPQGQFVHGTQHYVIEYTQRDVTRFFEDSDADEFYWDTNGTGWAQPFGQVNAQLTLTDGLADQLTGASTCYLGRLGSKQQCPGGIVRDDDVLTVEEHDLMPGENLTMAVGFVPGTFAERPKPFLERFPVLVVGGVAGLAASFGLFIAMISRRRESRSDVEIVPRYDPPEMISMAEAAEMLGVTDKTMTATLLDFAVRRKLILMYDSTKEKYGIKAVDQRSLLPDEKWTYRRLFGDLKAKSDPRSGRTTWFSSSNTDLGDTARALVSRTKTGVKQQGLLKTAPRWVTWTIVVSLLLGAVLLCLQIAVTGGGALAIGVGVVAIFVALIGIVLATSMLNKASWPTELGSELLDHLNGLRAYMQLADADRLRVAQSPSGSTDVAQGVADLYERLLPYAVLFGIEREWQEVLERYYAESQPDWFEWQGRRTHTWLPPIYDFDTRVQSAPVTPPAPSLGSGSGSGSSFSSFGGGSSGGGFSGGGGGGGGGRGI